MGQPVVHFEVVGKWGVERWFRIPAGLFRQLEEVRTGSAHVFAAPPKRKTVSKFFLNPE